MTKPLFRTDPYLREASATVTGLTDEGGIVVDASIFYPTGGGQPGDCGRIEWAGASIAITTAIKGPDNTVILIPAQQTLLPDSGQAILQHLDWDRRYRHMRVHTALHLLSVVVPLPVTGGAIAADKGRLDFDMPEAPTDLDVIAERLNALIAADHPVTEEWITDAELDANPALVKTLTVQPPRGSGQIRLIRIGTPQSTIDLQPCGGTHVARTGEIGPVTLGKIEKKGKINRRMTVLLT